MTNLMKTARSSNGNAPAARSPFGMYRELSEMFDNLFEESRREVTDYIPAVNIGEDRDNFFVEVSAPGYRKEDLTISVEDNMLTISAERKSEETTEDKKFSRREFSYGSFKRAFTLPETVDSDKIRSHYENGVLVIDLPKREEAKPKPPRKIEIG